MDLSLLRTFLAVYRAGSLTGAAPHLGLSQPTVTAQIKMLEAQLRQQLFERVARGVAPTLVAEELAREIAEHIDALTAVMQRSTARSDPFATSVHLGGPAEMTTKLVLPALADLVERGLRLRVTLGLTDDLLAGLPAGRFDVVVATSRPRGRTLSAVRLADEEFVLVGAPATAARLDARRLADDPADTLADLALIAYAEHLPIIRRYWQVVFEVRPEHEIAVVIPDLRGVMAMVAAGTGMSVLPRYLCADELAAGRLVLLHQPQDPPVNTFYLVTRPGATSFLHIAAVHDRLVSQARTW